MPMEQVQYVGNLYLNTYNFRMTTSPIPLMECPQPPQEKKTNLEETMVELARSQAELAKTQNQFVSDTRTSLNNQSTQIRNLEVQVEQMASMLNERQQGTLSSASEVNLGREGKEHCKAIILRSGKIVENSVQEDEIEKDT